MGRTACTEPQCLYSRAIPLLPHMDRTACTEPQCLYSRAIPLLPLWAVRPVQNLSACTVELYLYSPIWAVRPVQSLSASTSVHFTFFTQMCACVSDCNPNVSCLVRIGVKHVSSKHFIHKWHPRF